jgi:hypothetical protein
MVETFSEASQQKNSSHLIIRIKPKKKITRTLKFEMATRNVKEKLHYAKKKYGMTDSKEWENSVKQTE